MLRASRSWLARSSLAYAFVEPHWDAPGYPSFVGYGKNVEEAALVLTLAGVAALVLLARRLPWSFASFSWLAVVLGMLKTYYGGRKAVVALLALVAVYALYFTWYDRMRDRPEQAGDDEAAVRRPRWLAPGLLLATAAWSFLAACAPIGAIDLFHHGEVIASALDLLGGGTPFRTFFWSHGLSDTGVAALLIGLTGNRGLGTIVLLHAINAALLVATLYVLARGLIRDPLAACLAATLLAATVSYPIIISRLPGSLIAMLAFAVLSRGAGRWGLVATGALLGFGYLWRIDAGAYALAATILFLGCDRYSALGGSLRDQVLNPRWAAGLLGDAAALLAGAASLLLVMRLVAGFPTVDWFRTTLIEMPRHVRDSGGFPLPLPWRGVALSWDVDCARGGSSGCRRSCSSGWDVCLHPAQGSGAAAAAGDPARPVLPAPSALQPVQLQDDPDPVGLAAYGVWVPGVPPRRLLRRPRVRPSSVPPAVGRPGDRPRLPGARRVLPDVLPPGVGGLGGLSRGAEPRDAARQPPLDQHSWGDDRAEPRTQWLATSCVGSSRSRIYSTLTAWGKSSSLSIIVPRLLYPLLDRKLPTKYYCLGWAADPVMEQELIEELERNRVRAFLHVNGIGGSMAQYDVPDSHRIPRVHNYITGKETSGRHFETPLGSLTIRDEP